MPRTLTHSSDPRPNHPFKVTFVIEGMDAPGKPIAVLGDEYFIACDTNGSILFDSHSLKVEFVDANDNHHAEIEFVSRDGFAEGGRAFTLIITKFDDPAIQKEIVVTVAAVLTTTAATPVLPLALPAPAPHVPPAIATTAGVPRPGIPLIGGPAPTVAPTGPVATPPTTTLVVTPTAPVTPPAPTPTPLPKYSHPFVWAVGLGIVCAIVLSVVQYTNKTSVTAIAIQPKPQVVQAVPDATTTADVVSTAKAPSAEAVVEKQPSAPAPAKDPKQDNPPPPEQPAPAVRCGACP